MAAGKKKAKTLGRTEALQRIMARFRAGAPVPTPDLRPEEYVCLLDAVEPFLSGISGKERDSLFYFLYQGAVRHNRWLAARPPVVGPEDDATYNRFVDAFTALVPDDDQNFAALLLWRELSLLYRLADRVPLPLSASALEEVRHVRSRVQELPHPHHPEKAREFGDGLQKVTALLDGLESSAVATAVSTTVPFLLTLSPYEIEMEWRGLEGVATLTPEIRPYGESVFRMEPAGVNTTPTRWPDGETGIRLELSGLVDCQWGADPLQGAGLIPPPVSQWPMVWIMMFEVVEDLYWGLSSVRQDSSVFYPLPSDLASVTWQVVAGKGVQIERVTQGSPGSVFRLFQPLDKTIRLDLRSVGEIPWSDRCRKIAETYLRAGETRLGLFWLNVGVEALTDDRIREVGHTLDVDLDELLDGGPAYWDEAQEVVRAQMPDLADQIDWPDTNQHVSVWRKLKYLHRHFPMYSAGDEVMRHYRQISKHRNALFHGRLYERLPVHELEEAKESFEWLHKNLRLAPERS